MVRQMREAVESPSLQVVVGDLSLLEAGMERRLVDLRRAYCVSKATTKAGDDNLPGITDVAKPLGPGLPEADGPC